ncbi:MAG: outer membrane protein transport protein [Candidatus Margulisbacteria bacterium]|nr:outer membrane protein transport protein [Candidatus Margulisiibacteriota bacterium]
MTRKIAATTLALILTASLALAADLDFPYGNVRLTVPPAENPFPGLGNYYSTLDKGMKSALWNPASLGKLKLSEAFVGLATATGSYNIDQTFKLKEMSGSFEVGAGSGQDSKMNYALFFRYPGQIGGGIATKEVEVKSHLNYATTVSGNNFSAAQRVNDWLTVGFASYNPVGAGLDLAGSFPLTGRMAMNMYNTDMGDLRINSAGHLLYQFAPGITYESGPVWSGFLSQEVTLPVINISELRNDLAIQSPYIGTIAARHGNLYAGLNLLPIAATAVIDNDVRSVVSADTADQSFYAPNFDPTNQADLIDWTTNAGRYGTSSGYNGKVIDVPQGELIANAKYRGYYSGSAARFDLGLMYDFSEWFTAGVVMENIGGAALEMKGSGLASYLSYRDFNTQEAQNLFEPGSSGSWQLLSDRWITTYEAGGQPMYLEPVKNYPLPKRFRCGFALKRPFLIAVDLETNQTAITIPGSVEAKNITVSNLNFLRIGTETQVFVLPWWLRGGTTLALKPTVTGLQPKEQENIDKAFKFGALPLKLDLGMTINFWSYLFDSSFGVSALPLVSLLQVDTTNLDLTKMAYCNVGLTKDAWQVNYLLQADPLATAAAYSEKPAPAVGDKSFESSDLKFIQTLAVTYRF